MKIILKPHNKGKIKVGGSYFHKNFRAVTLLLFLVTVQASLISYLYGQVLGLRESQTSRQSVGSPMVVQAAEMIPATPTPTPAPVVTYQAKGQASYYSTDGCLGCNESRKMANGEVLDDTKHTVALRPEDISKYKLLNDTVVIRNTRNNMIVRARVTDSGGFSKYNRVADMSVATRDAINCDHLCEVEVTFTGKVPEGVK